MIVIYIAIGGILGTLLRYGLGGWIHSWSQGSIPWGTLAVNVLGSFILGFVMRASQSVFLTPEMRGFIAVGFCGALTTFSTYSYEVFTLAESGHMTRAVLYMFGSLAVGVLAVFAGIGAAGLIR